MYKQMMYKNLFIILIILSSLASCRKDGTSWDSDWIAPIINDSLLVSDFVNDSTLEVNADNSIQVILDRDLVDLNLSDLVVIPDTTVLQDFTLGVSSLSLSPGTNFIDEVQEHDFALGDVALFNARLSSGKAMIRIENPIPTKGIFNIELPGVTKDGVLFTQVEEVPPAGGNGNGVKTFELDLKDYSIDMRGVNGNSFNKLQSKMSVTTDPDGASVTMTNQDVVKFSISFEDLSVDYARGYFGSTTFSDTSEVLLDALANVVVGSINLDEINFDLTISNGIKVAAQGKITMMESINFDNTSVGLTHPEFNQFLNLDPAQGSLASHVPSEKILNFENGNSNIVTFLENLGYKYKIGYEIKINPWGNTSSGNDEIFPTSRVKLNLNADFPLDVAMSDLTIQDTFKVDFTSDQRFLKVKEGEFILKTENSFPFGGNAELLLLDENNQPIGSIVSSELLEAANANVTNDGHESVNQVIRFDISNSIAGRLSEIKNIILKVKMNSAYTPNNVVYANARLKFLLQTKLKLNSTL
jgi:hypothetical protein